MGYARVLSIAAWASSLVPAASAQCEVQRLVPNDPTQFAYFGYSVAIDQGFVLVGAPEDDGFGTNAGAAYVFEDQGGTWIQTAKLAHTGFGSSSNDAFGWAMELDGDTAWIGAPRDDPLGNASGAVFVFERSGSTWSQTTALSASDGYPLLQFGWALDLDGDVGIVGAWHHNNAGVDSGAAYVFERGPGGWIETQRLFASDAAAGRCFGIAVAVRDGVLVVGAQRLSGSPNDGEGSAYVFEKQSGVWLETARLSASDGTYGNAFGCSVAISDGAVLVGARNVLVGGVQRGAVYTYRRSGSSWIEVDKLLRPAQGADQWFGSHMAASDGRVLATAFDPAFRGAVYTFDWRANAPAFETRLAASDGTSLDYFGFDIAIAEDRMIAGAPGDDSGAPSSGSAYVYQLPVGTRVYCPCENPGSCGNGQLWAGCSNSTGAGARLTACGTSSASSDDIVLTASKLPPLHNTALVMGAARTRVPFGDGLRCIGPAASLFQFPMQVSSTEGQAHFGPGLVQLSQAQFGPAGHIAPGDTWYFQTFYRDPSGPCGSDFNATSALAVAFGP